MDVLMVLLALLDMVIIREYHHGSCGFRYRHLYNIFKVRDVLLNYVFVKLQ